MPCREDITPTLTLTRSLPLTLSLSLMLTFSPGWVLRLPSEEVWFPNFPVLGNLDMHPYLLLIPGGNHAFRNELNLQSGRNPHASLGPHPREAPTTTKNQESDDPTDTSRQLSYRKMPGEHGQRGPGDPVGLTLTAG